MQVFRLKAYMIVVMLLMVQNVFAVSPVVTSTAVTSVDQDSAYSYSLSGSDTDGDALSWSVKSGESLPSWLELKKPDFENVGLAGFGAGSVDTPSIVISSGDIVYVAYKDYANEEKATVKRFNGTTWEIVGVEGFSLGKVQDIKIAIDSNNKAYVIYKDYVNDEKVTVKRFNGTTWETVGTEGFSDGKASWPSIVIDKTTNTPYVIYTDDGNSGKAVVKKFNETDWVNVGGSATISDGKGWNASISLDSSNLPYVSYMDRSISDKITVKRYDGSNWEVVGTAGFSTGSTSNTIIVLDSNDKPYVVYRDGSVDYKATVMKFDGTSWEIVGTAGFSDGTKFNMTSLSLDSKNVPYITFADDEHEDKATVMKFNGASWEIVGSVGFSDGATVNPTIVLDSTDTPYVVYKESFNTYSVSVAKLNSLNTLVGTPTLSDVGEHNVSLVLSDGANEIDHNFTITVHPITPTITSTPITSVNQDDTYSYTLAGTDAQNDTLIWSVQSGTDLPSWLSLNTLSSFKEVGSAGISMGIAYDTSIVLDSNNIPYVAYRDAANSLKATVMKFNGNTWEEVGTAGFSAGAAEYISIALDSNNIPYVTYRDVGNSNKATVMKLNGNTWEEVGTAGFSAGNVSVTSIALDSNNIPYVIYRDDANGYKATVMKFNSTTWEAVGTVGFSTGGTAYLSIAIDSNNIPYISYADGTNSYKVNVMKFNNSNSSWEAVGSAGFSADTTYDISMVLDSNNTPYVAYRDFANAEKVTAMKFNSSTSTWEVVGSAGFSVDKTGSISIAVDSNNTPYVAYRDVANSSKATVMRFNSSTSTWEVVDTAGFSAGEAHDISIVLDSNNIPYVAYMDNGNGSKVTVMKFDGIKIVMGGIPTNADVGEHNVSLVLSDGTNEVDHNFTITVSNVNDAPTASDFTFTIDEDSNKTFGMDEYNAISFSDVDENTNFEALYITSLPASGTLTLSGVNVTENQVIFISALGNLVYTPEANANATPYATIGFKVNDGESNSTSAYTATINVNAVDDIQTITSNPITSVDEDSAYSYTLTGDDLDGDDLTWSVKSDTQLPSWLSLGNKANFVTEVNPLLAVSLNANAKPAFVDIDNDGDMDVFIGNGFGDDGMGHLVYFKNIGTNSNPIFEQQSDENNPLSSLDTEMMPIPTFVDIDNDTDMDLFVSDYNNNKYYYKNTGTKENPNFVLQNNEDNPLSVVGNYGSNPTPTFVDIDNDGDLDLFIGTSPYNEFGIHYYKNIGTKTAANYEKQIDGNNPFNGVLDMGSYLAPFSVDIDNDGDYDMFVGNNDGVVKYFENTGTISSPIFIEQTGIDNPFDGVDVGSQARPVFVDIDNDSVLEVFIGDGDGKVSFYENKAIKILTGTPTNADVGEHNITLVLSDGTNEVEHNFTITVNNTNDAPTNLSLSKNILPENSTIGTIIADLNTTDIDIADTFTYTLCGGTNDANFTISGNNLKSNAVFDYETKSSYSICLKTTDSGSATYDKNITINITNIDESVAGVCGTADVSTFQTAPTTGLCNTGTASTVTKSNDKFIWSCTGTTVGSDSGSDMNCDAGVQSSNTGDDNSGDNTGGDNSDTDTDTETDTGTDNQPSNTAEQCVEEAITSISFEDFKGKNSEQQFIHKDLNLTQTVITSCAELTITWKSSDSNVITDGGVVTVGTDVKTISLVASVEYEKETTKKLFLLTVRSNTISDEDILKNLTFEKIKGKNDRKNTIVTDLNLTQESFDKNITWTSNPNIITNDGNITRQSEDTNVTLTATIGTQTKEFNIVIKAIPLGDDKKLQEDKEWLNYEHILGKNKDNTNLEYNLANPLPTTAPNGSTITWKSSNSSVLKNDGTIIRSADGNNYVVLTASFTLNGKTVKKEFIFKVLQQKPQEDIETTFTRVDQEAKKTTVVVKDKDGNDKNTTVEFDTGVVFERTIDEESVKQSAEFSDKKLDLYLNTDGTSQANSEYLDENNNTVISSVKSNIPGTKTTVNSSGKTISTVSTTNSDINATINEDGTVQHIVKTKNNTKSSKATSKVKGSTTVVNSDGSVETTSQTIEGDYIIKAVVTTSNNGESTTKFVKENTKTQEQTNISNTMSENTPYEAGNEVTIDKVENKLYIKTVAPLGNTDLIVE